MDLFAVVQAFNLFIGLELDICCIESWHLDILVLNPKPDGT